MLRLGAMRVDELDPGEREDARRRPASGRAAPGRRAASGRSAPETRRASAPQARPTARHGLNAAKTSPSRTLAHGMPTQKRTKTTVGAMFAVAVWLPASPA